MDRNELIIAIAFALFAAFFVGWILHWLYSSLAKINSSNMQEIDDLANQLHQAEEAIDHTVTEYEQKLGEAKNQLAQCQAELAAAMTGLGNARREAEELRNMIEK